MAEGWRIAVVGATGTFGEALVRALSESTLGIAAFRPVASERSIGQRIEFRGDEHAVLALGDFDFRDVDFALFAVPGDIAREHAPRAAEAGAVVIDASDAYAGDADVPLVAADLNPGALDGYAVRQIVRTPAGLALALARVLAPVAARTPLRALTVAGYHAVAGAGRAAVDELAAQCGELLNGRPSASPGPVFPSRIAFNCVALGGLLEPDGRTQAERTVAGDLGLLLGLPDLPCAYTAVWVPVFYGDAAAVSFETEAALPAGAAEALVAAAPGVRLDRGAVVPTPAGEGVGQDEVSVGRWRAGSGPRGQVFWLVADLLRLSARNSVTLVEVLAREHF